MSTGSEAIPDISEVVYNTIDIIALTRDWETTSRERILWRNLNEHSSLRERAGFGTEAGEEDNAGGTARRLIRRIGGVLKVGKGSQVT